MASRGADQSWVDANPGKTKLIVLLICLLLIEGMIRICVWAGLLPYEHYPTSREPQYWAYIDPVVGIWRYPHGSYVDEGRCFTATYSSNSVGARDRERSKSSDAERRVIVLGDSFVEGYGYDETRRFTELLEERTGVEHLNWGTAGGFGTIQEWLLYENIAREYDHSDVMLFILPDNDFEDNDPSEYPADAYRPYLSRTEDGFAVYYPVEFDERYTASRQMSTVIKNTLDNEIYILNLLRWVNRAVKDRSRALVPGRPRPTYEKYAAEDLEIFLYALERLVDAVEGRRLYLYLIPRVTDMEYARDIGYEFALVDELSRFADGFDNVEFMDLLPRLVAHIEENDLDLEAYTLGCDHHWGRLGHEVTADIVYEQVFGDGHRSVACLPDVGEFGP